MRHPLVSVILPVFNEARYLAYCLESLEKQTYDPFEIIVVDDGSTDGSREIAKKFHCQVFGKPHNGAGAARNFGAKRANGAILVFPDADMRYDQRYIENLIKPILSRKAIGTFNKEEYVANPENIWSQCWSINSDLPVGRRAPENLPDRLEIFRAIDKRAFLASHGFDTKKGYFDDNTVAKKIKKDSLAASGTKAYHYNPETLSEVFMSSRWIGRGMQKEKTLTNIFRYSFPNSLRIALKKISQNAPFTFIIFKIIYDAGMLSGIFLSGGRLEK